VTQHLTRPTACPVTRRHALSLLPALASTWAPTRAQAQVSSLNDAINKAGRQRMLSQRCAKAYLALGQGVRPDHAEKVLADSIALFDRQLVELHAYAPTAPLQATYEALDTAWRRYKTTLVGAAPQRDGAKAVVGVAGQVLALAHQGTQQLEVVSGQPLGRLVNMAGRQRMLSQRMAALYLAASWGVQAEGLVPALRGAQAEFVQAHAALKAAPETTPAIRHALGLAEQQYGFFDSALRGLQAGQPDARQQADVFATSERILQVMDQATGEYARAGH